jgi:hypothetical protein
MPAGSVVEVMLRCSRSNRFGRGRPQAGFERPAVYEMRKSGGAGIVDVTCRAGEVPDRVPSPGGDCPSMYDNRVFRPSSETVSCCADRKRQLVSSFVQMHWRSWRATPILINVTEPSWLVNIRNRVEQPANHSVLVRLRNGIRERQEREERETPVRANVKRLFVKPSAVCEPPLIAPLDAEQWGVHPEITERVWQLGAAMPCECRTLVYGSPALLHPQTGVIFVYGGGTCYFCVCR